MEINTATSRVTEFGKRHRFYYQSHGIEAIIIMMAYGVALILRGQSWIWLLLGILNIFAFAGVVLLSDSKEPKNFFESLIRESIVMIIFSIITPITLRLAFYSGFWGLIQSVLKFNLLGIIYAIISLYFGRKLCIYLNKVFEVLV